MKNSDLRRTMEIEIIKHFFSVVIEWNLTFHISNFKYEVKLGKTILSFAL